MPIVVSLLVLLLSGCAAWLPPIDPLNMEDRPMAKACLADPPPETDISGTSFCQGLTGIDERERIHRIQWDKLNELKAPVERPRPRATSMMRLEDLDAEIEAMEAWGDQLPSASFELPTHEWRIYTTPHGTYTNLGHGRMMGPNGGLYIPY